MRNYIHIMLCANLFVAQLLFVVGIERTEDEVYNSHSLLSSRNVRNVVMKVLSYTPQQAVCMGISVTLQYLFLVTFMWMLMEGVVLYVSLVRVFVTHTKRYITAFTLASYGQWMQHE